MSNDPLDTKLNEIFTGKVVRKDLLLQVKKGTNVPSFVLEFLLARYCASDDPREIQEGMAAVLETIQQNYVRPDESEKAKMLVAGKGKHTFIDKIHVKYNEKERRPWARMENFNSSRIAINERFYKGENDRIFEGGIWAEVTIAHNDVEDDDYAFYVEALKPIQLSKFNFESFVEGRSKFTRDEWLDVIIRSFGLEPLEMTKRLKFHYLARLAPLVESNYNLIELGPRGNGKSYTFSEFSPYATLLGAPTSAATLWWNNQRKQVGIIGFWDLVAFDEVGEGLVVKDRETFSVMQQYMANGNFTRPHTVTANASLVFVGNIDDSIQKIVNSTEHTLFKPLHPVFNFAIQDRFHNYIPGWEIPKNKDESLTRNYGLIVEYLAEAFHHLARKVNRYTYVKDSCKLGSGYVQRDQTAVLKTVCAFVKMLHPGGDPTREELNEYLEYAIEGRRRVKEQLNKKKDDDEFATINMGYFDERDQLVTVWCPESKDASATQFPMRHATSTETSKDNERERAKQVAPKTETEADPLEELAVPPRAQERHYRIHYGATGYSYETIFKDYLPGARELRIEDPYIRQHHQIINFLRFCETVVRLGKPKKITLVTKFDNELEKDEAMSKLFNITDSLKQYDVELIIKENSALHDREILLSSGWSVKIGRGFDIYQRPDDWLTVGANDLDLRNCLETNIDIIPIDYKN
jgi:ATP-dependent Lon protease